MAINPADITTIRYDELPPDGITVDSLFAIANGTDLYKLTAQDLINFININVGTRQYQFIELYVDQAYIDTNFDVTGLGIGICEGIAICNGQNGTPIENGLVHIGYGTNYNVINAIGGYKDAAVISHKHIYTDDTNAEGDFPLIESGFPVKTAGAVTATASADGAGAGTTYYTSTVGVSGTNRNLPPYRVVLRCMKL